MKNQLLQYALLVLLPFAACKQDSTDQPQKLISQTSEKSSDQGEQPQLSFKEWSHQQIDLIDVEDQATSFGIDFGDINNDGLIDLLYGDRYYLATGEQPMAWKVEQRESDFQGMAIMYLGEERGTGIVGLSRTKLIELLPNLDDPSIMNKKMVAEVPQSIKTETIHCRTAQLVAGGALELLITGREGIYMVEADDMEEWSVSLIASDANSSRFDLGDLDRDDDLDIVAAIQNGDETEVVWFENPGDGSQYWNSYELTLVGGSVKQVGLAMLDGDDRLDLVLNSGSPTAGYTLDTYMQADTGWVKKDELLKGMGILFEIGDIDGNGSMDVTTMHTSSNGTALSVWPNDGNGNFSQIEAVEFEGSPVSFKQVDIDQDGDLDVLYLVGDEMIKLALFINDAVKNER